MIGHTAFDLAREHIPADLRAEAWWWVRADGTHGKKVHYVGEEHGIHHWLLGTDKVYLKSKPKSMSNEDVEKLEKAMRWYYERERERMVDDERFVMYSDMELGK